jgi:uncharacterized protein involved in outer membrane biogenesis
VIVCVAVFPDVNRYKTSIEEAVSQSLGMKFEIRGNVAFHLLPRPRLALEDIHLAKGTSEILSAEELQVSPRWIQFLLHRRISIDRLALRKPQIRIEQPIDIHPRPGSMSSVTVQDGEVSYRNPNSGLSVELKGLKVRLSGISWGESDAPQSLSLVKSLSLHGTLHATSLQIGTLPISDMGWKIKAKAGVLKLDPTELSVFGGPVRGSLTLDLHDSLPRIRVVQEAPQLDLGQVFPGEKTYFAGTVQASIDAEGTGSDLKAIMGATHGRVAIRGKHLSIDGWDVDQLIEDYNRTQKFDLVDLGAVLVAGPFGPLLTKGADFARLYGEIGHGKSEIRTLVSDWEIVDGIATAKDVAFATMKNTVAFRGGISLIDGSLQNFFVATVDQRGCVQVKQRITGSLGHPQAPGLASRSVLGAFESAVGETLDLLGSQDKCELFYSGSALP